MFFAKLSLLLILSSSLFAGERGHVIQNSRPRLADPKKSYQACLKELETTIDKLKCEVPPVLYRPGLNMQRTREWGIQFYAARLGINTDRLNAVVSLTQTEAGKKKLVNFFSGLKCAGLPGDPIERKNWKSFLPTCPDKAPKSPPWYRDSKWSTGTYHIGAHVCFRLGANRPPKCPAQLKLWECIGGVEWMKTLPTDIAEMLKDNSPSVQCCYDKENTLISTGAAAGTPDMVFKTQRLEEVVDKEILKLDQLAATVSIQDVEDAFEHSRNKLKDGKASMEHYIMDARIITACFPDWPGKSEEHVATYQSLGWAP